MEIDSLKELLERYGIKVDPDKIDQHFMVDDSIIKTILEESKLSKEDVILEIGPGLGFLTKELVKKAKKVYAIEIDPQFKPLLRKIEQENKNLEVIYDNAMKIRLPRFNKIISNLPYNLAEPLVVDLMNKDFEFAILTVSKYFAEKLAYANKYPESKLAQLAPAYFETKILKEIPPEAFYPMPRVDSAIIRLKPIYKPDIKDKKFLFIRYILDRKNFIAKNALRDSLLQYSGEVLRNKLTKKQAKQIVSDYNFSEKFLTKPVVNLSSEDIIKILNFYAFMLNKLST